EAAEHVGANSLAFVGAANLAHVALVGRDAEMVRPEPDEPLDEADLGIERGSDARLGFGEINLLRHAGTGIAHRRRCRRRGGLILHLRRRPGAARWIGLLRGAFGVPRRPLRLLVGECNAGGGAARQQIRVADAAGARAIQFREQRAARVRGYSGDRSGAWTEAESMQGERGFRFRIGGHASLSSRPGRGATPQMARSSAGAVSRLRPATFRNHGHGMKDWKGVNGAGAPDRRSREKASGASSTAGRMASCRCNMHPISGCRWSKRPPHIFAVNCSVRVPHHWRFRRAFAPRPEPLFLVRFQTDASDPRMSAGWAGYRP